MIKLKRLDDALQEIRVMYLKALRRELKRQGIGASGRLEDSLDVSAQIGISYFGTKIVLPITMEDYGLEVDAGTKPLGRMENTFKRDRDENKIREWLTYPNVIGRLFRDKQPTKSALDSAAFFISRKLENFGKKPTDFISKATDRLEGKTFDILNDAFVEEVDLNIDKIITVLDKI